MNENQSYTDIYETCKRHMHSYVLVETTDGLKTDGIITGLDEENLYLAVPINQTQSQSNPDNPSGQNNPNNPTPSQFGRYPYPGYGPGFGPGYGYGYGSPRRFRRLIIPLTFLASLSLLPWY